ncbi:MAG TPA: nucleotide exchange factor GrpE [Bacteroidia bacterium]|nr:nucleotide exchange factor GrpE [Bacteroidia bacterium]
MVFRKNKRQKEMNKNQQMVDENEQENPDKESILNQPARAELPAEPEDETARLEESLALEKDKYLRLIAEFDNYKKRNLKERIELLKSAGEDIIVSILPVLDDFERAAKADALPEGISLIYNKFISILNQKGLTPMDAAGKDFDPDLHDALSNIPVEDEKMKNKVLEEIEKGYFLNDKVVRHAKVIVGK